ncbi:MAG: malectin domain-containing carbohydrate-binding protein [Planctomycetota bacterium]
MGKDELSDGDTSAGGVSEYSRRSASDVPAANTSDPFIFDAFALGLKRCIVLVTTPRDDKGAFTVRLGFAALRGDKPGRRAFDVRLNGKAVLKDFDIVKEAGAAHSAVWKEFTLPPDGNLVLDLVAKAEQPTPAQVPLINGMEILRKEIGTLGFNAPASVWLNEARPEKIVDVHVANHRSAPFSGKLVVEARGGIVATLPNAGAIELQPGTQKKIEIRVKNSQPAKSRGHAADRRATRQGRPGPRPTRS